VTLGLYLSRVVGMWILVAGVVLLLLGLGFDLLRSASGLIERGGAPAVMHYAWLRVPLIGTTLFPIAVLSGATIAFHTLAARSEVAVARAAGQSIFGLLRRLAPLALLMGVFFSQLGDRISDWAENSLAEAFPPERADTGGTDLVGALVWTRINREVVRAHLANADGTTLDRVTIYRLDAGGHLAERLSARSAAYTGSGWMLSDATRRPGDGITHVKTMDWPTRLSPEDIVTLARGRRTASSSDARAVLAGQVAATRGRSYYSTRIARTYAAYAVPAVMLVLAALSGFGSARAAGGARLAALAIALGFLYVATDGLFASLGEVGAIGPRVAAFTPSAVFAVLGGWGLVLLDN